MSPRRRKRLDPSVFQLPQEQLKAGEYSDRFAALIPNVVRVAKSRPRVLLQVTAKQNGWLSGIDEAVAILKGGVEDWTSLTVNALYEGDLIEAWDTVMTIEGDYGIFAHLETLYLGVLAHRTRVCSNVREIVDVARPKSVLFFALTNELSCVDQIVDHSGGVCPHAEQVVALKEAVVAICCMGNDKSLHGHCILFHEI